MSEEKLITCRLKHKLERLVTPLMKIVGVLVLGVVLLGWFLGNALAIYTFFTGGEASWALVLFMAVVDALLLMLAWMFAIAPVGTSVPPHVAVCAVMLVDTILLILSVVIIDYSAIVIQQHMLIYLIVAVVSALSYLILSYSFMYSLCEFEKMAYNKAVETHE